MENLILFLNGFLSYLLVFVIFLVAIIVAVFVGIALRKNKNSKAEGNAVTEEAKVE